MTIDARIKAEKVQCVINREVVKLSALSPCKIDKYEYLVGNEILTFDKSRIIEQARFTYFSFEKLF